MAVGEKSRIGFVFEFLNNYVNKNINRIKVFGSIGPKVILKVGFITFSMVWNNEFSVDKTNIQLWTKDNTLGNNRKSFS